LHFDGDVLYISITDKRPARQLQSTYQHIYLPDMEHCLEISPGEGSQRVFDF